MPQQDTAPIKEKIISLLKQRGPSLPMRIANSTGLSSLFASAFLSELVSEKKIKISSMKIGNSPLYFLPEQKPQLENFTEHLNSKEKQAFDLLKEKKFLKDSEQEPAIRVALRTIRDFAIPFKRNDEIFWRFYNIPEEEFKVKERPKEEIKEHKRTNKEKEIKKPEKQETETKEKPSEKKEKELDIFGKEEKSKPKKTKKRKKSSSKTKKEKFFNNVKEYLDKESIRLKDILNMGRNYIVLLTEKNNQKKVLVAFNKKRINETDINKASKKAKEHNLQYILLSKGGPLKRIKSLRQDLKNLSEFKKIK